MLCLSHPHPLLTHTARGAREPSKLIMLLFSGVVTAASTVFPTTVDSGPLGFAGPVLDAHSVAVLAGTGTGCVCFHLVPTSWVTAPQLCDSHPGTVAFSPPPAPGFHATLASVPPAAQPAGLGLAPDVGPGSGLCLRGAAGCWQAPSCSWATPAQTRHLSGFSVRTCAHQALRPWGWGLRSQFTGTPSVLVGAFCPPAWSLPCSSVDRSSRAGSEVETQSQALS